MTPIKRKTPRAKMPFAPSNSDLAHAIERLELRQDSQDKVLDELQKEIAPLRDGMTEILGMLKFVRAAIALISAVGTVVAVWSAIRGH